MVNHFSFFKSSPVYTYNYIFTGLEKGGFALPSANHFWVYKCELLWPTDSHYL